MRKVTIIRPKRMLLGAVTWEVRLDGAKVGKIGNGKTVELELDENAHTIEMGKSLLGKFKVLSSQNIPGGSLSYVFRLDLLEVKANSDSIPVLRAEPGAAGSLDKKGKMLDHGKYITQIGTVLTQCLLDGEVRRSLKMMPEVYLTLQVEEGGWELDAVSNGNIQNLADAPFAKVASSIVDSAQRIDISSEEFRARTRTVLLNEYINPLPDYEVAGDGKIYPKF